MIYHVETRTCLGNDGTGTEGRRDGREGGRVVPGSMALTRAVSCAILSRYARIPTWQ